MTRTCTCQGCSQNRAALSPFCKRHNSVYKQYGHPKAGPVKQGHYASYRQAVVDLIDANEGHQGLTAALTYLGGWMQRAVANENAFKGASEVSYLARHGITAKHLLIEACAFNCYLSQQGRSPLPDQRSEAFALSRALLLLAPRPRRFTAAQNAKGGKGYSVRPSFAALDSIGSHLRAVLANVLANVSMAVADRESQAQDTLKALSEPLKPPVYAYLQEAAAKA
jgi:hypothetical protein